MIDLLYEYTEDNLMLQGTYFDSNKKDICILFVHGQAQSILDNEFACMWGKYLSSNGGNIFLPPIIFKGRIICLLLSSLKAINLLWKEFINLFAG